MAVRLPTSVEDWQLMAHTARLVVTIPTYAILGIVSAAIALSLFVLSQNLTLVGDLIIGGSLPLDSRLTILTQLYPFVGMDYTPLTGSLLVVTALLIGVNVTMAIYHFRENGVGVEGGGSLVAVMLGTLGAGCAACGSAVLVALLSVFGVTASLTFLPLEGLEFALLALVVVALSIYWLADGMRGGFVNGCPVDLNR